MLFNSTLKVIDPKVVTMIFLKQLQGVPVATRFLPERTAEHITVEYQRWGNLGGITPESGEGTFTRVSSTEFSEEVAKCIEYREGEVITEQAILYAKNIVTKAKEVQARAAEHLSDRMILRQEYNTVIALKNNASNVIDLSLGAGTAWDEANADPLDDFTEGRRLIWKNGHVEADQLLINSDLEADLLQTAALKQWQLSGPMMQSPLITGSLSGMQLRGLTINISNCFYLPNEITAAVNREKRFVLDNTAIIFKAGGDLGNTFVSEPFTSRVYPIEDQRMFKLQVFKTMVPTVFRPQFICTLANVRTDAAY